MPISSNNSHITFNNSSTQNTAFLGSIAAANITGQITAPQIAPGVIPSGGFSNMQVFTSPGTFTTPPTTTKIKVTVVGGGGSSATIPAPTNPAVVPGAGGGGFATRVTPVSAATPYPVTVGGAAGTSSFGSLASATGGASTTTASSSGAGGIGSIPGATTCGYAMPGQTGVSIITGTYGRAFCGGDAGGGFGKGGMAGVYCTVRSSVPGTNYGGGASGLARLGICVTPSCGAATGGTGAPGIVIVEF